LANRDSFQEAFDIIEDAKIANPDYFEVYRCEAYIAFKQSDHVRAGTAYETAIELDRTQPQLYLFYGTFLMRAYNENKGATEQFDLALGLKPNAPEVLREAVRARLYESDFAGAQVHADHARKIGYTSPRFETIFTDLQIQIYYRQIEFLVNRNMGDAMHTAAAAMLDFLKGIRPEIVDPTLSEHLRIAKRIVSRAEHEIGETIAKGLTAILLNLDGAESPSRTDHVQPEPPISLQPNRLTGRMRTQGRKPNFAFLRSTEGQDTFLARSAVPADLWNKMVDGAEVTYTVQSSDSGKTKAADVLLAK
jgi:tetratricopeptide (TPR) repeat protein/cold shock CspA family protein